MMLNVGSKMCHYDDREEEHQASQEQDVPEAEAQRVIAAEEAIREVGRIIENMRTRFDARMETEARRELEIVRREIEARVEGEERRRLDATIADVRKQLDVIAQERKEELDATMEFDPLDRSIRKRLGRIEEAVELVNNPILRVVEVVVITGVMGFIILSNLCSSIYRRFTTR